MGDGPELPELKQGERIKDNFTIIKKLGEGGFGAVYAVTQMSSKERYAMKIESIHEKVKVLKVEVIVLKALEDADAKHVARVIDRGRTNQFNFVVMTLLGPTLNDIRKNRSSLRLSLSSALRTGKQCIVSILDMHNIGFLHRDIKPGNYCIGRKEIGTHKIVYMLDFGLARKYIEDNGVLKVPRDRAGFRGTLRYAPLNCHWQREMCRKDDLETWMYMQIEMTSGKLPWRDMSDKDKVGRSKELARRDYSLFRYCPPCYQTILEMVDNATFYQTPEYEQILKLLCVEQEKGRWRDDDLYDWESDKPISEKSKSALKINFDDTRKKMVRSRVSICHSFFRRSKKNASFEAGGGMKEVARMRLIPYTVGFAIYEYLPSMK